MSRDMILFGETDVSIEILKELVLKNIQGKGRLTYGQLGRVTMVLLGSSNSKTELYKTVLERLAVDLSWRSFFMVLSGGRVSSASNADRVQLHASSLAFNLHKVLSELYGANWKRERDCISGKPHLHFDLVDRLMISLMECRGVILICRSSLVEWLIHREWKPTFNTTSVSSTDRDAFENGAFGFLGNAIHQLIVNKHETLEWVKKVSINVKDYPVLLLRLVVLMCVLNLGFGMCWPLLQDVLNTKYIMEQLPADFCSALDRKNQWLVNLLTVSAALNTIGDPLVIISLRGDRPDLLCKDAIHLQMDSLNREDLLRNLFLDNVNSCQDGDNLHKHSPSNFTNRALQLGKQNRGCVEFKYGNVWELLDSLKVGVLLIVPYANVGNTFFLKPFFVIKNFHMTAVS